MLRQLLSNRKSPTRRHTRRLGLQQLESRQLLAVDLPLPLPPPLPAPAVEATDWLSVGIESVKFDNGTQPAAPPAGNASGNGGAKQAIDDLTVTQTLEPTSTELFVMTGSDFDPEGIKLNLGEPKLPQPSVKFDFGRPRNDNGSGSKDNPTEEIDLNYGKIEFEYKPSAEPHSNPNRPAKRDPLDDLVLPAPGNLGANGEPFFYYAPAPKSAEKAPEPNNGSTGAADANEETHNSETSNSRIGNSLLGPGGVVDRNGAAANKLPANGSPADKLPVVDAPATESPEIEQAIRQASEALSRLQNHPPLPSPLTLPYLGRLFRNVAPHHGPNDHFPPLVFPRIIIVETSAAGSQQAGGNLVDVPTENAHVFADPLTLLQDLRNKAAKKLAELNRELDAAQEQQETIGDLTAQGEGDSRTRQQQRVALLRSQIAVAVADLDFLNDPRVVSWARNWKP